MRPQTSNLDRDLHKLKGDEGRFPGIVQKMEQLIVDKAEDFKRMLPQHH